MSAVAVLKIEPTALSSVLKKYETGQEMSIHCEHCGAPMRLVTDVPDVGKSRGVRFYACTGCEHIHIRPVDWNEHFAPEQIGAGRERLPS